MTDFIVAFVGLPSSGKSSVINSLVLKRLLQSGVCRTTTEFKQIEHNIIDDNNNKFKVFDLPGICDSEENDTNFNDLTYAHITNSNLIIWTSDVNKAFITTHEVNEYNKLKNYIKKLEDDSGTLYHLIIMLSKCDKDTKPKKTKKSSKRTTEEIEDSEEDTDINDLIHKVKEKFPDEDIILYNAYGRSYFHKNTSTTLKTFVKKMIGEPTKNNIIFDISKYIKTFQKDQQSSYYNKFLKMYDDFINNKIDNIMIYWNNITYEQQKDHLLEICNINYSEVNYKRFTYINLVSDKFIKDHEIIRNKLLDWYLTIIKHKDYLTNGYKQYSKEDIIELFIEHYSYLSKDKKINIYNNLLFENKITDYDMIIQLIKKIYSYGYDRTELAFYDTFNEYIMKYNKDEFNIFYNKMKQLLVELDLIIPTELNIYDRFDYYINKLNELKDNEDYILLNKLEILDCLYNNNSKVSKFYNFSRFNNFGIPYERLKFNNKYLEAINKIWLQIYSNIKIEFNGNNYNEFVSIDKTELLYNFIYDNELD